MGLGGIGHVIAWRILPPHTIAAHSAALSNSRIYCRGDQKSARDRSARDSNQLAAQRLSIKYGGLALEGPYTESAYEAVTFTSCKDVRNWLRAGNGGYILGTY